MKTKNTKLKNLKLPLLVAGVLLTLPIGAARAQEPAVKAGSEGIQWREPTPAINEVAKAANKLIMADFYADWCGYCKMQDATSYEDDRVILMTDQVVATKIDGDARTELKGHYNVNSYPTVLILTADGQEIDRKKGASREASGYVQWLGGTLYKNALPNLNASLEQKPDDIKLLTIMALTHSAANRKDEVPAFLDKAGDAALVKFNAGEKIARDNAGQMARTFRLLSLYFESQQDYDRGAASLYYLSQLSTRPREVVAARIALAESFFQTNRTPKAITELESLLKLDTLSTEERQKAQNKLDEYKKVPG